MSAEHFFFVLRIQPFAAERKNYAADKISCCYDSNGKHSSDTPCARYGEIEHIGNAVLESAKNKHSHTEKQGQILADLMGGIIEAVNSYVYKNIA